MTTLRMLSRPSMSHAAQTDDRRLLPDDDAASEDLPAHLEHHGESNQIRSGDEWREAIVREIECACLVGHGGAAFPTGRKLRAVLMHSRRPVVIGNGTEGEPASMKDRVLLARAPHLVLDGASLAADIVQAREVIMVVHREVRGIVDAAVDERRQAGLDRAPISVVTASDRFVAGEASAVVNWVDRGRPVPLGKPPRMSERGVGGRPTLVQNVETLAHLALIGRHGSQWYRDLGTRDEPGSMLVTLAGSLVDPGVYEVAVGTPVSDVLSLAGGPAAPLQAFLVGGYFGTWLPAEPTLSLPLSAQGLGVGLGAGLIVAFPADTCGIVETARLAHYLASESAGQCGPCKFGLPAIAEALQGLAEGRPTPMADLRRWLVEIDGRGACGHPDGVAHMIRSALEVFSDEVHQHSAGCCSAPKKDFRLLLPSRRG